MSGFPKEEHGLFSEHSLPDNLFQTSYFKK